MGSSIIEFLGTAGLRLLEDKIALVKLDESLPSFPKTPKTS
jgi:hypothetical protein